MRIELVVTTWGSLRVVAWDDYGRWKIASEGHDLSEVLHKGACNLGHPIAIAIKPAEQQ